MFRLFYGLLIESLCLFFFKSSWIFVAVVLAQPHDLQDLSSPTRGWTQAPGSWEHRVLTTAGLPGNSHFCIFCASTFGPWYRSQSDLCKAKTRPRQSSSQDLLISLRIETHPAVPYISLGPLALLCPSSTMSLQHVRLILCCLPSANTLSPLSPQKCLLPSCRSQLRFHSADRPSQPTLARAAHQSLTMT